MNVSLEYPEALLLGALLVYLYWRFVKTKNLWRHLLVLLAVLLFCYPAITQSSKSFDLYLLVDRSRSMSDEALAKQNELLELAKRNLGAGDRLGVVSFNEHAYIEQALSSESALNSFQIPYSADASDLSEGLATVLSLAAGNRRTKILVLSDGEYTGQDPTREAQTARQNKIPLFYRDLRRTDLFNLFVSDVQTPEKMLAKEPYRLIFKVNATAETPGRYRVLRDGNVLGRNQNDGWKNFSFAAGENRIPLNDSLKTPGIHSYRIEVEATSSNQETVLTDNTAEKFVSIVGERPVLLINPTGQSDNLSGVLSAGGLSAHIANISNFRLTLNQMEGYKGIILNNVPITRITKSQIDAMRDFVLQEGGGILVCGGNQSFAAGGYYRSSLEDLLPVSLEDRKQAKKVSTAFSFVLDRSGSMAAPVAGGGTKMDLANAAAVESLKLLSGADSLSVIAVDSAAHIFVPQQPVENPDAIASDIRRIVSMGGGIFTDTGLIAAGAQILQAPQANKHILLFADAADAEEPGDYKNRLEKYKEVGITVSVVGLGKESDVDSEFLKDVARHGNGQSYFTEDPGQLIQFFTADTITYTRKSFVEESAPMKIRAAAYTISPEQKWEDFPASGYNLLFPREKADVAIGTADSDQAPILAFWQRGLGRVASLALDVEGQFSETKDYPDITLNTVRWIMGSSVFDNLQIKTDMEGSYARIRMEVGEDERAAIGEAKLTIFTPGGETLTRPMQWDSHNQMSSSVKLTETGAYRGVVTVGDKSYKIGPVSMPISPEFAYERGPSAGRELLSEMATLTGGREILDLRNLFDRERRSFAMTPIAIPLLILFLLLLLADVAEARFGMLPWMKSRMVSGKLMAGFTRAQTVAKEWVATGSRPRKRTKAFQSAAGTDEIGDEKIGLKQGSSLSSSSRTSPTLSVDTPSGDKDMDYLNSAKNQARRAARTKPKT